MKSLSVFLLMFLLSAESLFSQTETKGKFGFAFGPGFASGKFAASDVNDTTNGLALTGLQLNLHFEYELFSKGSGIAVLMSQIKNPFDIDKVREKYESQYPNYQWNVTENSWKLYAAGAGLYFKKDFTKISAELRVLAGYANLSTPNFTMTFDSAYQSTSVTYPLYTAKAIFYDAGIGLTYPLKKNVAITLQADYFYTHPNFHEVNYTILPYFYSSSVNFTQKVELINIGVGLSWMLK